MNKKRLRVTFLVLAASCLGLGGGLWADEAERAHGPGGDSPLSMLYGTWTVKEELNIGADGPAMRGKGEMVAKPGPGGHSVLIEYTTIEGPMTGFALTEVIAKEPGDGKYSLIWVDAFSPGIKSMSGFFADSMFTFTRQEEVDGDAFTNVSHIRPESDGGFVISSFRQYKNGDRKPSMRLTASRATAAPSKERGGW